MSHVTTIKMEIRDLDALEQACQKIGLQFKRNQTHYKWFGQFVGDYREAGTDPKEMGKCNHAISVPGNKNAYEIGVAEKGDHFELRYDFWSGGFGLEKLAGKRCANLTEAYTQVVALNEAKKFAEAEGYTVTSEWDAETSETVITMRKY
jgi:hypothetical protein